LVSIVDELKRALALIGPKWTLQIIKALLEKPRRFTELERALVDVNPKVLTDRRRELVETGRAGQNVNRSVESTRKHADGGFPRRFLMRYPPHSDETSRRRMSPGSGLGAKKLRQ